MYLHLFIFKLLSEQDIKLYVCIWLYKRKIFRKSGHRTNIFNAFFCFTTNVTFVLPKSSSLF